MPNLTSADGTPTGGVYGFATLAIQLMKQLKPDYVAVAWDKPKTNIRKRLEIYPKYKASTGKKSFVQKMSFKKLHDFIFKNLVRCYSFIGIVY